MQNAEITQEMTREVPVWEAFESVRNLMIREVGRLARRPGDSPEDTLQELACKFHSRYGRYDASKGALSTWTAYLVRSHVLDARKARAKRPETVPFTDAGGLQLADEGKKDLEAVSRMLSESGRELLGLLINLPDRENRPSVQRVRTKAAERLRREGWSLLRISRAFQEIKEALWD